MGKIRLACESSAVAIGVGATCDVADIFPLRQMVVWNKPTGLRKENEPYQRAVVETVSGILREALCLPDETVEAALLRMNAGKSELVSSFPLDADSLLHHWFYHELGSNDATYLRTKEELKGFLSRLQMPSESVPITSAQYNFLHNADRNRRQAIIAYPWLLDALTDRIMSVPEFSVAGILEAIDSGRSLNAELASMFRVRESVIRRLHTFPRQLLTSPAAHLGRNLLEGMASTVSMLELLPANAVPSTDTRWRWLWEVLHWTHRNLREYFRIDIAAKVFLSLQDHDSGFEVLSRFGHLTGDGALNRLRTYLQFATGYQRASSRYDIRYDWPHDSTPLFQADKVLAWALEHRSPRWMLRLDERIRRSSVRQAMHSEPSAQEIPHFELSLDFGSRASFRRVVPIRTIGQMIHEGRVMGNCLERTWPSYLEAGTRFLFSIRDQENAYVAHLEVCRDFKGSAQLGTIKGPLNREADECSIRAADDIVTHLNLTQLRPRVTNVLPLPDLEILPAVRTLLETALRRGQPD
jgi:hypothetical protein